jgi:hypothetical protein
MMQAAAGAYRSLQSQGLEVRYSYDPQSRRATAELRNTEGEVVQTLSPSEAIALASDEELAGN